MPARKLHRLAQMLEGKRLGEQKTCPAVDHAYQANHFGLFHRAVCRSACQHNLRASYPIDRLGEEDLLRTTCCRLRQLGVSAAVEQRSSVQVKGAEATGEHLGTVDRELARRGRAV